MSIFLLGFLAGGFALNAYHLFAAAKQPTKQERYDKAFSRLGLSDTQKAEVQKLVGEIREFTTRRRYLFSAHSAAPLQPGWLDLLQLLLTICAPVFLSF